MMKILFAYLLLFSVSVVGFANTTFTKDINDFLGNYTSGGMVDYEKIKNNPQDLAELIQVVATKDLNSASKDELKAFYINAYNLIVIKAIASKYPVKSPMDIPGLFDKVKYQVAGEKLTLNELEKKKLLEPYQDARIHFAVVCAAKGCPKIAPFAYEAGKIEQQLEERTKLAINDPYFIRVKQGQKKVEVSQIFEWYKGDFKSILPYLNKYRKEKIPASYAVTYYPYDWALNDI